MTTTRPKLAKGGLSLLKLAESMAGAGWQEGDFRVWWIPQVPMAPFFVQVATAAEGWRLLDILAAYDAFQFVHRVKPDYANVGGLARYESDGDGLEWCDVDTEDEEHGLTEQPRRDA